MKPARLRETLRLRDERHVSRRLSPRHERRLIMLERTEPTAGLAGKSVDACEFPDGRLEIRRRGVPPGYRALDKDQRATHAAATANERRSAAPEQEAAPPKRRRAGEQRAKDEPTGRRNDGWNRLTRRKAAKAEKPESDTSALRRERHFRSVAPRSDHHFL